jgi:glycosyltransferase involved in cell wall biosynthesis
VTAGLAALSVAAPVVFTTHYHGVGHTSVARRLHRFYRPLGRRALERAGAVVAVSAAERDLLVHDFPAIAARTVVIPNGVTRRAPDTQPRPPTSGPVLLSLGRLERYKGVDRVLHALVHVPAEVRLVVCGEGPDRTRLELLARTLGVAERVSFLGRCADTEVAGWLAACTALVTLSPHESFGLVVAEALSAGARVVCSAIPPHQEICAQAPADRSDLLPLEASDEEIAERLTRAARLGRPAGGEVTLPTWQEAALLVSEVYARVSGSRMAVS